MPEEHLKKQIEASYQEPISKTTDAIEEDRLRHKMAEESRQVRDSYFEFDGTPSAYDSGYLKGEFTHRNGESLLRVRTKNTQDYFFFINDKLWKRYRAFDASVFERCPRLRVIARTGVGIDTIDLDAACSAGVVVTTTPGANEETVAEIRHHWDGPFHFGAPDGVVVNVTKEQIWVREGIFPDYPNSRAPQFDFGNGQLVVPHPPTSRQEIRRRLLLQAQAMPSRSRAARCTWTQAP